MNDDENVLNLSEAMARNYTALQNFLNGTLPENKRRNRGRSSGGQDAKKRDRKSFLISLQNHQCADCNHIFVPDEQGNYLDATADHVIPFRYGSTLDHNCEFVCQDCNQEREYNRMAHILRYFGSITE